MNDITQPTRSLNLYAQIGTASASVLLDVRSSAEFSAFNRAIPGAIQSPATDAERWLGGLSGERTVVVYDHDGSEQAQIVANTLRKRGVDASYLANGIVGWNQIGLPTRRILPQPDKQWVTREHPKIDRIACPWLIRRFINTTAEFIYVPKDEVVPVAKATGAIPYDIADVEFTHEGDQCSFDAILRIYDLQLPALTDLATIVRGADTSRHDLAPQSSGLFAISLGLSANFPKDHEMLEHGMVIYDALYSWCRSLRAETHNWPPGGPVV
jgi:rhodanese-related sulfurtransferase